MFNLLLVLAVLSCVGVFTSAARLSGRPSRQQAFTLFGAVALSLLLATAHLGAEWVARDVAGQGFSEPQQALQAAKAVGGELGVINGYTTGLVEASFRHHRENAIGLLVATLLCLGAGLWTGRRRGSRSLSSA